MSEILGFIGYYWYFAILTLVTIIWLLVRWRKKIEYNKFEYFQDVQIYSNHDIFHQGAGDTSFYYGEVKRLKQNKIDTKNNKEYKVYFYKDKHRVWCKMRKKHIDEFEKKLAEGKLTFSIH